MDSKITVPYGDKTLEAKIPENALLFKGEMEEYPPLYDLEATLKDKLDNPTGCPSLKEMIKKEDKVLILIEDNTRNTPVKKILPILIDYLKEVAGIPQEQIEILTAPGTHRVMTEQEIIDKVGKDIKDTIKIHQHDFTYKDLIADLGEIEVAGKKIPILVNKKALEADFIIGLGNIIPHSDAGFSGGAKIVQPGICGFATTAATHIAGALLDEIPLGDVENPCRQGIEEVGKKVGLKLIINVVMNPKNEVVSIVTGDFIKAHREGAKISGKVYGVKIPELADIVVVSSSPCDIDYWQAEKGLVSAYFTVKKGGYIIFVAPCYEGLEHNHPRLSDWLKLSHKEATKLAKKSSLYDEDADLVAADIAMANARVREKAKILVVSDGLSQEEIDILGYMKFDTLQEAVDYAFKNIQQGKIGVLPRGGDCLPVINHYKRSELL